MSESEQHSSGLIYFIPYWIFESDKISWSAKMVYALLSGLAHGNEEKTCYPSNEYIAKRLKISTSQAERIMADLDRFGAISRITIRNPTNPFKPKRIITVHLELKESLPTRKNAGLDNSKNAGQHTRKNAGYRNKEDRNKEIEILSEVPDGPVGPSPAKDLTDYFWNRLKNFYPKMKEPNFKEWTNTLRLMNERDNRSWEDIRSVMDFALDDAFWVKNILSADKLRKQFDKLMAQMTPVQNKGGMEEKNKQTAMEAWEFLKKEGNGNQLFINKDHVYVVKNQERIYYKMSSIEFEKILLKFLGIRKKDGI